MSLRKRTPPRPPLPVGRYRRLPTVRGARRRRGSTSTARTLARRALPPPALTAAKARAARLLERRVRLPDAAHQNHGHGSDLEQIRAAVRDYVHGPAPAPPLLSLSPHLEPALDRITAEEWSLLPSHKWGHQARLDDVRRVNGLELLPRRH